MIKKLPRKSRILLVINALVIITSVLTFLYLNNHLATTVKANHINLFGGKEGWYCADDHTVWHDLPIPQGAPNPDDYHAPWEDCGADEVCRGHVFAPGESNYSQDANCVKTGTREPKGEGTNMYATPPSVEFNHQIVFGITADKNACYDKVTVDNLRVLRRDQDCHVTAEHCGCDEKHIPHEVCESDGEGGQRCHTEWETVACGPDDWHIPDIKHDERDGYQLGFNPYDNKQCYRDITCTAIGSNQLNAPLRTGDAFCDNNVDYTITEPQATPTPSATCNPDDPSLHNISPEGDHIITKTLDDDKKIMMTSTDLLVDKGVASDEKSTCQNQDVNAQLPPTTVDRNFLTQIVGNVACGLGLQRLFPNYVRCIEPINVSQSQTNCNKKATDVMIQIQRDKGIHPRPKNPACAIQDTTLPNGSQTEGNATMSAIQTSIAGDAGQGVYTEHLPKFMDSDPGCVTDKTKNLNLEGKVFNDDRVPNINGKEKCMGKSYFPIPFTPDF